MTVSRVRFGALSIAAALAGVSAPALASDSGRTRIVTIGVGPQVYPKYIGADELGVFPMPIVDIRDEGDPLPFETPDEGIGFGLLGDGSVFNFGPAIQIQNERDVSEFGLPDAADIDTSVELGAFVELNPAPWVRFRLEGRKAVSGHDGFNGDFSIDFVHRTPTTVLSVGPRVRFSDEQFQRAYFGAAPGQALPAGLFPEPEGGIHAVGAVASIFHQFSERWGMYGYAGYDRLVGDAEDGAFTRIFGSTDQFSAGIGLHYSFRIGGR